MPRLNFSHLLSRGLVAAFPFYEKAGTVLHDLSGKGNNGTLVNGPVWTSGAFGSSLFFDGVDDHVETAIRITSPFSFSLWLNGSNSQTGITIADRTSYAADQGFQSFIYNGDYYFDVQQGRTVTPCPNNTWTLVTGTYDNATVKLYINGVLKNSVAKAGPMNISPYVVWLGNYPDGAGNAPFSGKMDAVCIYNRALSAAEVRNLYTDPFAIYRQPDNRWLKAGGTPPPTTTYVFMNQLL